MKQHIRSILAVLAVVAIVLLVVIGGRQSTEARSITGNGRIIEHVVTALPTAVTYGTPIVHADYGNAEVWVNPTLVPTDFVGSAVLEQGDGTNYIALTPTTILGNTGVITHGNRATPVVFRPDRSIGTHSRVVVNESGNVTGTVNIKWILGNDQQ